MNFEGSVAGSVAGMLGISGDGDTIGITPVLTSGEKIATFTINEGQEDEQVIDLYAPEGFSGSWNDLTDKPDLFSGVYADLTSKPTLNGDTINGNMYTNNYSSNEKRIGTWIDGKALYRKSLNITTTSNDYYYSCSDLNIDQVVNLSGYVEDNNSVYNIPINCYERSDFNNKVYFQNTNKSIYIGCVGYYPSYVTWVINIEYTKTTDSNE